MASVRKLCLLTSLGAAASEESTAASRQLQAQSAPVKNADRDCFLDCWKTAGYCNFCGEGNACCPTDTADDKQGLVPRECVGVHPVTNLGFDYQCVASAYTQSGVQQHIDVASHLGVKAQAQCISYMAEHGCGWTNKHSCPGQPVGSIGQATPDGSEGYHCCCENQLWTQSVAVVPSADRAHAAQCAHYLQDSQTAHCKWTLQYSCPGQTKGSEGYAEDDGSTGYHCCCSMGHWREAETASANHYNAYGMDRNGHDPNAFDVGVAMDPTQGHGNGNLVPSSADSGFGINVAPGAQHGNNVANRADQGEWYENHDGPNVRVKKVSYTDPNYKPSEHHRPIRNFFSENTPETKKERCSMGICSDLGEGNEVGNENNLPETQMGMPVKEGNAPKILPNIEVKMDEDDSKPVVISQVKGAVVSSSTNGAPPATQTVAQANAAAATEAVAAAAPATEVAAAAAPVTEASAAASPAFSAKQAAGDFSSPDFTAAQAVPQTPGALANQAKQAFSAKQAAPAEAAVSTALTAALPAGSLNVPVANTAGLNIGDKILIGEEQKTITNIIPGSAPAARRLGGTVATPGLLVLDSPTTQPYAANAKVQKVPASAATQTEETGSSSGSSGSSASMGPLGWVLLTLGLCLCVGGGAAGAFMMFGKKKKRSTTDREAYLKNDFIEQQPNYDEQPEQQPMMSSQDNIPPQTQQVEIPPLAPMGAPVSLQPTQSFPVQVELAQTTAVVAPGAVSFPGLPTLGGGQSVLLQQPSTTLPATTVTYSAPQATSMVMTQPYGNYTTQSQYLAAPAAYSQVAQPVYSQLGMTTPLTQYPVTTTPSNVSQQQ